MGRAYGDRAKMIKTIFVSEKFNFLGKKVFSDKRFRIKGWFCMSLKMTIPVQNPMLRVNYFLKGSVSTAFAVWKYFSCIKKQLILCFDETKIDLKPLIMLF